MKEMVFDVDVFDAVVKEGVFYKLIVALLSQSRLGDLVVGG